MNLRRFFRFPVAATGGLLLACGVAVACGPDFPNAYLGNTLDELAALPDLDFASEVARIFPPAITTAPTEDADRVAEVAEARQVLIDAGMASAAIDAVLFNYQRDHPPAQLPPEFQLYAQGARAWHADERDDAMAAWTKLLELPETERRHRTVWAAYMLGRARADHDHPRAREACHLAQAAAAQGFADSQHLAAASLGWEARTYLEEGKYDVALTLYARQFQAGVPSATTSLQLTLRRAFRGAREESADADRDAGTPCADEATTAASFHQLREIAGDPELRGLVAAWFVSHGGPHLTWSPAHTADFKRWIAALGDTHALSPEEADRWAWAAYQSGDFTNAARLAERALPEAPAAEWVRAMLLLRKGFVEEAAAKLAVAARAFPLDPAAAPLKPQESFFNYGVNMDTPVQRLAGVRGVLALRREQFVDALRLFVSAGQWADAAYVAERVLTADELVDYVRNEAPASPAGNGEPAWGRPDRATAAHRLRALLARRLAREHRFEEASEFFPADLRGWYGDFVADVRLGYNEKKSAADRAGGFWRAAQLARLHGMELFGTELEPDYAIWDGSFEWPGVAALRGTRQRWFEADGEGNSTEWMKNAGPVATTAAEFDRVKQHSIPSHRFHYRYRAAELAWLAAALLPNNDDRTAEILNTAGRWIAPRDPEAADLYYKTLVLRCPHTALGRRAAGLHWLVPAEDGNQ